MKVILFILISIFSISAFAEVLDNNEGQCSFGIYAGGADANSDSADISGLWSTGFEAGYKINNNFSAKIGIAGGFDFFDDFFLEPFEISVDKYTYSAVFIAVSARTNAPLYVFGSLGVADVSETFEVVNASDLEKDSTNLYFDAYWMGYK